LNKELLIQHNAFAQVRKILSAHAPKALKMQKAGSMSGDHSKRMTMVTKAS
jgi:hypothetical protein